MKYVAIAVLALLFLTRCGTDEEPVVALQVKPLIGTWRLIQPDSTYGVTLELVVDPNNPPIDITPFDATGKSAVNTYKARLFAAADGKASVDNVSSTKMGGSPQALQFEQTYLTSLQSVVRYEVTTQNQLRLYYGNAQSSGVLVYRNVK